MKLVANNGKKVEIKIGDQIYLRYAIKTHFITPGENYIDIFKKYISPIYQKGDIVSSSEKIISLCQNKIIKREQIKIGIWAKILSKFASHPGDKGIGVGESIKMQYAINKVRLAKSAICKHMQCSNKNTGNKRSILQNSRNRSKRTRRFLWRRMGRIRKYRNRNTK